MKVSYKNIKLKKLLTDPLQLQKKFGNLCNKVCSRLTLLASVNSIKELNTFSFLELNNIELNSWEMNVNKDLKIIFNTKEYNQGLEIIIVDII